MPAAALAQPAEAEHTWLADGAGPLGCLGAYPAELMGAFPVTALVNAVRKEGPELVRPLT